jgi:hypothetical protein
MRETTRCTQKIQEYETATMRGASDSDSSETKKSAAEETQIPDLSSTTMESNDMSMEYSSSDETIKTETEEERKNYSRWNNKKGLSATWQKIFKQLPKQITIKNPPQRQNTPHRRKHQTVLQHFNHNNDINLTFGHPIEYNPQYECFLFHNINGIKDKHNWAQINLTMLDLDVTCFGFAEINTTARGIHYKQWTDISRKTFTHSRMVFSESDIKMESNYKPGGTTTAIVGKWQARITEKGADASGMGRWTYFVISSNKNKLVVITAYKPCKTTGPNTTWTQQWLILRERQRHPDPLKEFCNDLDKELQKWKENKHEIILMLDANEEIGRKPGGLGQIIAKNGLFDVMANQHNTEIYPPTYARGTKRIDYIFGTEKIQQYCKSSGILPFNIGYPSDHAPIYIRIDLQKILATEIHPIESHANRLIVSATPKERENFLRDLDAHYQAQNLYDRLNKLWEVPIKEWDEECQQEYNACDEQHIIGMLAAERKTCKEKRFSWSPTFSKAVETKAFWKIILSLRRNHYRPTDKIINWARTLGIDDIAALSVSYINTKLREAQNNLREIKRKAAELREMHLMELFAISQSSQEDKKHEKRLKILIRAHRQKHTYKKLQYILKPSERGGLSSILVPKGSKPDDYPYDAEATKTWTRVHDHKNLQAYLQQRNQNHFGQAHGTPFTVPPLDKLDWGAQSSHAEQLLNGIIPDDLKSENEYVMAVLKYIAERQQLPEIETYQSPDEIAQGFRKWKESTSTSPSGCHLGLRRISGLATETKELETIRSRILQVQAHIINIPTATGFTPERWKTVVNAMLEKIPGKPYLHKLRVIHLLEADYNLTLKNIFGRRLLRNCEQYGTLGDFQDGFRKGRSTTRTLLHNELLCDYNKRLRIDFYIGMTDISACFDRILPPIISLLNRRNGCPKEAVKMHANTLKEAKYFLKTQQGLSTDYYSNETSPVYGNGQGAGDSPSQWSQESAMLFQLYQKRVAGATMSNNHGNIMARIPLAAFADDTNLLGNNDDNSKNKEALTDEVKSAFYNWNGLLHATGHSMELSKCACYLAFWDFQEDGYAFTIPPSEHGHEIMIKKHPRERRKDSSTEYK